MSFNPWPLLAIALPAILSGGIGALAAPAIAGATGAGAAAAGGAAASALPTAAGALGSATTGASAANAAATGLDAANTLAQGANAATAATTAAQGANAASGIGSLLPNAAITPAGGMGLPAGFTPTAMNPFIPGAGASGVDQAAMLNVPGSGLAGVAQPAVSAPMSLSAPGAGASGAMQPAIAQGAGASGVAQPAIFPGAGASGVGQPLVQSAPTLTSTADPVANAAAKAYNLPSPMANAADASGKIADRIGDVAVKSDLGAPAEGGIKGALGSVWDFAKANPMLSLGVGALALNSVGSMMAKKPKGPKKSKYDTSPQRREFDYSPAPAGYHPGVDPEWTYFSNRHNVPFPQAMASGGLVGMIKNNPLMQLGLGGMVSQALFDGHDDKDKDKDQKDNPYLDQVRTPGMSAGGLTSMERQAQKNAMKASKSGNFGNVEGAQAVNDMFFNKGKVGGRGTGSISPENLTSAIIQAAPQVIPTATPTSVAPIMAGGFRPYNPGSGAQLGVVANQSAPAAPISMAQGGMFNSGGQGMSGKGAGTPGPGTPTAGMANSVPSIANHPGSPFQGMSGKGGAQGIGGIQNFVQGLRSNVQGMRQQFQPQQGQQPAIAQAAPAAGIQSLFSQLGHNPFFGVNQQATQAPGTTPGMAQGGLVKGYAEGGQVQTAPKGEADKVIVLNAVSAIKGRSEDPQADIQVFVQRFGQQALQDLAARVQGGQFADVEKPGTEVQGSGDGLSDTVPAQGQDGSPVNLSDGEFVVPADVVSHLGNGSSGAGAQQLHGMLDRIRQAKTGTTQQAQPVDPASVMPA